MDRESTTGNPAEIMTQILRTQVCICVMGHVGTWCLHRPPDLGNVWLFAGLARSLWCVPLDTNWMTLLLWFLLVYIVVVSTSGYTWRNGKWSTPEACVARCSHTFLPRYWEVAADPLWNICVEFNGHSKLYLSKSYYYTNNQNRRRLMVHTLTAVVILHLAMWLRQTHYHTSLQWLHGRAVRQHHGCENTQDSRLQEFVYYMSLLFVYYMSLLWEILE